jgi:hypothetical protein
VTTLAGKLPKDHGLNTISPQLIDSPTTKHVVIMVVNCRKVTTDMDSGDVEPTARILRIEAVRRADYSQAEMLLRRSVEDRHGSTVLPFDTEEALKQLFAEIRDESGSGESE